MRELLAGLSGIFATFFGGFWPAEPAIYQSDQPAAAIVAQTASTDPALPAPAGTSTVINQFITQPVIERQVLAENAITRAELDTAFAGLRTDLLAAMQRNLPSVYTIASPAPSAPVSFTTFAHSQKIDQLANVTITNATVSGVMGLTDQDIPDTITASNYLPLSGGTLATASSSQFSVFDRAYFGGVATSTFDSLGSLTLVGSLTVSTTTATSTFAGGLAVSGLTDLATTTITGALTVAGNTNITQGGQLTVGDKIIAPGEIGVGTSTPWGKLSVVNTGTIPSFIVGDEDNDTSPFIITASGNVGIGTTSPSTKLHLHGTDTTLSVTADSTSGAARINFGDTSSASQGYVYYRNDNDSLNLGTNGSTKLHINSTGNVGIGTTTPWGKLSVTGSGTGTGQAFVVADSANTPRFNVLDNGSVGIGTTSPSEKLHILSASDPTLLLDAGVGSIADPTIRFDSDGEDRASIFADRGPGGGLDGVLMFATARINGVLTETMRLDNAGNVGIGTSTPWRTLSVTGTVGFDGLTGTTGAGSLCLSSTREVVYNAASDACQSSLRDTKHDINPLVVDALSQVLALQPVSFVYNEGDGRTRYGFIAEDTAAVDPRLTTYSASGSLSGIDDRSVLSIVVKAIQELASKIAALFASDNVQNAQIAALEARIAALEAEQGSPASDSNSPTSSEEDEDTPDTEAPVITINGNNPATLQVGDSYNDLGATVSDNMDQNLGYQTFLGSTPWASAHLDTSAPNEWHIHYVATDNAGNTATSTRTVIVQGQDEPEPEQQQEEEFEPEAN